MRILVVGAGASLAEAQEMGLPEEFHPPLISNFAKKLWRDFNPHPVLDLFLESLGHEVTNRDGRELFYQLESERQTDIEHFFEFAWRHRSKNWEPRPSIDPDKKFHFPRTISMDFN